MPTGWPIAVVVEGLAIAALIIVVIGALRQISSLQERVAAGSMMQIQSSAAAVGTRLPVFASAADDGVTEPAPLLGGRPAVMLFLSPGCGPCQSLTAEITSTGLPDEVGRSLIAVIASGSGSAVGLPDWVPVLAVPDNECDLVFGIRARPFAMAVNADGVITAKQPVNIVAQLTEIASSAWSLDRVP